MAEQEPLDIGADGIVRSQKYISPASGDEEAQDQLKSNLASCEIGRVYDIVTAMIMATEGQIACSIMLEKMATEQSQKFENKSKDKDATMSPNIDVEVTVDDTSYTMGDPRTEGLESEKICYNSNQLQRYQERLRLEYGHNTEPICTLTPLLGIIILVSFFCLHIMGRNIAVKAERRRIVRQLVDVHPKDRSAEVKKLADCEKVSSLYPEGQIESYLDAVNEKENLDGLGP